MSEKKIPVILDCDTGGDDSFAIGMCIASDKIDVLGVTTVAGNYTLPDVLLNTRRCLSVTDPTVPYAVGAAGPDFRELHTHGVPTDMFESVGDPDIAPASLDAVEFLYEKIMGSEEPVTLLPLGPLTNIYHLFEKHPDVKANIKEMVIMGGSVHSGNVTKNAEFNIYVDPEAAREVFKAGVPIVLFGLEVCNDAYMTVEDAKKLAKVSKAGAIYARELTHGLDGFGETGLTYTGYPRTINFDAATVIWLLNPDCVYTRDTYMEVIAGVGHPQDGCTFTDWREETWNGNKPNVKVALAMDNGYFNNTILELFAKFD